MNGPAGVSWRVFRAGDAAPTATARLALLDGTGRTWTRPTVPGEACAPLFAHAGTVLPWPLLPFPVVAFQMPDYEAAVNRDESPSPPSDVDVQALGLIAVRENDHTVYLACPHCEARDSVIEIYLQRRENTMNGLSIDGSQICIEWLTNSQEQDESDEFHERYACAACRKTVARPKDLADDVPQRTSL